MTRGFLTLAVFISVIFFPWQLSALLAIGSSLVLPFLPLAAGLFADTLYYAPHSGALPLFTIYGALSMGAALFVRSRFKTSIMRR